ncbi:MAG: DEAD/DEAH box helicase [Candidatus Saccharimonadales bacterium]
MPYYQKTRPSRGNARPFQKSGGSRSYGSRGPKKEYINPQRFIKEADPLVEEEYTPVNQFSDFATLDLIKANLAAKGYKRPSPIQDQAIPIGLAGNDIVGIANTGTGKTAAFAVPMLDTLIQNKAARSLIMAPTRELAEQIQDECRSIAKGSGLNGALLIGGSAMGPQLRDLRDNPRIVIGTPGRIKDHLDRGTLKLSQFNIVVLDEVDRMLDMGFIHDMRTILARLNEKRQSFFFSATMDDKVRTLIQEFSENPTHIAVKTGDTSRNVHQDIVRYRGRDQKIDMLHDLLIQDVVCKTLVFDDTQRSVEKLCIELEHRGFKSDAIHGGKSQAQRQRALRRFKDNNIEVLVATDVAARGIDVSDITHVVNYSTPQSYSDYVHRIGRTGRAGNIGYALTFIEA